MEENEVVNGRIETSSQPFEEWLECKEILKLET